LNMYIFDHFSHKQIAELRGISVNTSKSHLLRARKELQQILFNKAKNKKRPLMAWFFLFPNSFAAFDRYCRWQMEDLSFTPMHPLSDADLGAAATTKLPAALKLYTLRTPLVAGLGTIATGTALLTALPSHQQTETPQAPAPQTVEIMADSTTIEEPEIIVSAPEPTTPVVATPKTQTQTRKAPEETSHAEQVAETTSESANPQPVIVKKVLHKQQKTIIVKDSTKR